MKNNISRRTILKKGCAAVTAATLANSTHLSYSIGSFFDDFIATVLGIWVFKFYETEVFLPIMYITVAIIIYGLWNAFNDPIAGHISGYSFNFMKRFGKRFSWFIIGFWRLFGAIDDTNEFAEERRICC